MRVIFFDEDGDFNAAEVGCISYLHDNNCLYLELADGFRDYSLEMSEREANVFIERAYADGKVDLRNAGKFIEEDDDDDDED